jgi:flagellar motor switch protein FliG
MNEQKKPENRPTSMATPAQRAAIVIAMLGEATARPIMEKLDDGALARVKEALETIALIPRNELTEIVVDFLNQLRQTSGELLGGKLHTRDMITNIFEHRKDGLAVALEQKQNEEGAGSPVTDAVSDPKTVWVRLAEHEPEKIATYLNGLSPNLASLVLRRLDVTQTSEVLNFIDETMLQSIMERLIEPENDDPEITSVIGRMVELEFLNLDQTNDAENREHLEGIGEILSLIPTSKRDSLVEFLRTEHESKLESIQKALFTLESLPELLPRAGVSVVFREYGTPKMTELLLTLAGPLVPVSEFLLTNISSRLSDQIREELNALKPLDTENTERVQREFLLGLMTMKRKGLVTLLDKPTTQDQ